MLSALFTFGLFRGRALQRRPSELRIRRVSPMAGAIARGLYYVLPNMAAFDVKAAVVHGRPVTGLVLRGRGDGLRACSMSGAAAGERRDLLAAGFQVAMARSRSTSVGSASCGSPSSCLAAAIAVQYARDQSCTRTADRRGRAVRAIAVGRAQAAGARLRRAARRRLLDSRGPVLRWADARRAARREARPPLSAARHHDDARSLLQHRLPLRVDFRRRRLSAPAGAAGSRNQAAREGFRGESRPAGSISTTSRSSTTGGCATYPAAAAWFKKASEVPGSPEWMPGSRLRRSHGAAIAAPPAFCGSRSSDRPSRIHARERQASPAAARRDRRARSAQCRARPGRRTHRRIP